MLVLLFSCLTAAGVGGQTNAQERANSLRLQLEEVQTKLLELQNRLQDLEELLKTENIERSLSGIGSTHPEALWELRQRQLTKEKLSVQKQLNLLAESRMRLETGLAQAETDVYHQSAKVPAGIATSGVGVDGQTSATSIQRERRAPRKKTRMRALPISRQESLAAPKR